ncbi:Hypothetical predicted protein [Octopus vulgaris]|uniref:Uncharacterized protein n=1 Tax=Octopus vulgaris TaxID=6645 RepID=A0AA36FB08_OCTVU|nr:Hypothetical predicted protein [Octopus vulgaris]
MIREIHTKTSSLLAAVLGSNPCIGSACRKIGVRSAESQNLYEDRSNVLTVTMIREIHTKTSSLLAAVLGSNPCIGSACRKIGVRSAESQNLYEDRSNVLTVTMIHEIHTKTSSLLAAVLGSNPCIGSACRKIGVRSAESQNLYEDRSNVLTVTMIHEIHTKTSSLLAAVLGSNPCIGSACRKIGVRSAESQNLYEDRSNVLTVTMIHEIHTKTSSLLAAVLGSNPCIGSACRKIGVRSAESQNLYEDRSNVLTVTMIREIHTKTSSLLAAVLDSNPHIGSACRKIGALPLWRFES